jgi:hypothetical protein
MASSGSDEVVNIKCCVCLEEKRTREAEKYCCECKDYYCSSCVEIHQKVPSMKGHKILQKSDFKTLAHDGSLPSFPTRRCFLHIAEVVNMYCEDHDEVACASCIALSHRYDKLIFYHLEVTLEILTFTPKMQIHFYQVFTCARKC